MLHPHDSCCKGWAKLLVGLTKLVNHDVEGPSPDAQARF